MDSLTDEIVSPLRFRLGQLWRRAAEDLCDVERRPLKHDVSSRVRADVASSARERYPRRGNVFARWRGQRERAVPGRWRDIRNKISPIEERRRECDAGGIEDAETVGHRNAVIVGIQAGLRSED